jgi:hypothetical protein
MISFTVASAATTGSEASATQVHDAQVRNFPTGAFLELIVGRIH